MLKNAPFLRQSRPAAFDRRTIANLLDPSALERFARLLFLLWCLVLGLGIAFFSQANLQADPIDYYTNLQKIVDPADQTLMPDTHFAAQRSPGESILSVPAYAILRWVIAPLAATQVDPHGQILLRLPPVSGQAAMTPPDNLPPVPVWRLFFRDFQLPAPGGTVRWTLFGALLLTSFLFLGIGIIALRETLKILRPGPAWQLLIALVVTGSPLFLFNILLSPGYPTLISFGCAALLALFLVRGNSGCATSADQILAGLAAGMLVLVRLEAVVVVAAICLAMLLQRRWIFLLRFLLGGLVPLALLAAFNLRVYGHVVHLEILHGDINILQLNPGYLFDALLRPSSSILTWSFFIVLGIVGLFIGRHPVLLPLGIASLVLLALYCCRVPIMYLCVGGGAKDLGGIMIGCLPTQEAAHAQVQSDMNRYIILLAPFAILGLQNLLVRLQRRAVRLVALVA